jgi:hypothetical protein
LKLNIIYKVDLLGVVLSHNRAGSSKKGRPGEDTAGKREKERGV